MKEKAPKIDKGTAPPMRMNPRGLVGDTVRVLDADEESITLSVLNKCEEEMERYAIFISDGALIAVEV